MVLEFIFCLLTTPKCVLDEFDRAMLQLFAGTGKDNAYAIYWQF